MQKVLIGLVCMSLSCMLQGQSQQKADLLYTDASSLRMIGQAFPLKGYHRIDTSAHADFPAVIKRLLTHSAGLVLSFKTNSPRIAARWCVSGSKPYNNMTSIVNKGLDLYIKKDGRWVFAGVGRPDGECSEFVMVRNMEQGEKECLLYLPTYDAVKSLSVGIDSGFQITAGTDPFTQKKVVIYGSSITQGASASRPGMAYPARLSRNMGINFINLGLSGNGKMEKAVADMVASIQADAFILDCFANPSPQQITQRTGYLVKAIRSQHPEAPIIMIQSVVRETGNFDLVMRATVRSQNEHTLAEYQKLLKEGVKHLYLIPGDHLLGTDHEGTIDGGHPNDLGFDRMLKVIQPALTPILR